eukprot:gene12933-5967_t
MFLKEHLGRSLELNEVEELLADNARKRAMFLKEHLGRSLELNEFEELLPARKRAMFLKEHLGRSLELNEFEELLAANVINPAHIDVDVDDVHGLEEIVTEMTRGVLLYGPPGYRQNHAVKALAKHSGCYFLNITSSSILSKWLGDASKLVRAIFSLAEKLQPCIIFIDEVDAMLGRRGSNSEHEATLQVKTEFMQMWDGMESNKGQRIVVMGATNRPSMIDEAVLRRFSTQYEMWDGMESNKGQRIVVMGATNRPSMIDEAVLRRFSTQYK